MRATSQIHNTITGLVAAARLAYATAQVTLEVYDGPEVSGNNSRDVMWLGIDNPDSDAPVSMTGSSEWAQLGNNSRDEKFVVYGALAAWSGDENCTSDGSADVFAQLRGRAFTNLAVLETAIRNDPSVGAVLTAASPLRQIGLQVTRVSPVQNDGGSAINVGFQFQCWTRI